MERTRRKSSKELLEEKQMKRYHRSKKRSQNRNRTDNEISADDITRERLTDKSTEVTKKHKEAKESLKNSASSTNSSGPNLTTKENTEVQSEIRKASKTSVANDSSKTTPNRDTNLHCEELSTIVKKENVNKGTIKTKEKILSTQMYIAENTSTSKEWVEEMNITNKKVSFENVKLKKNISNNIQNTNGNCPKTDLADILESKKDHDEDKSVSQTRKDTFCEVAVAEANEMKMVECTKTNNTSTEISKKIEKKVEKVEGTNLTMNTRQYKTILNEVMKHVAEASEIKMVDCTKTNNTSTEISNQTEKKVEKVEGTNITMNIDTAQTILNEVMNDHSSNGKNHETSSPTVDKHITNDDRVQTEANKLVKSYWLDSKNVWLDKYLYNDAEKQYHQNLSKQKKSDNSNNKITKDSQMAIQETVPEVMKDEKADKHISEGKTTPVKESVKPKPKVAYEIIEEIVERTEITYYLVDKETEDVYMKEKMKEYETQNLDFKQYLSQLGSYVKRLENRVKTLEEGQKKVSGERSSSLSSNTSDEGVDMTGGSSDLISDFRMKGQMIEKLDIRNEIKELSTIPRKMKSALVF